MKKDSFFHGGKESAYFLSSNQPSSDKLLLFLPGVSDKAESEKFYFIERIAFASNRELVRYNYLFQQEGDREGYSLADCVAEVEALVKHLVQTFFFSEVAVIAKSFSALVVELSSVNLQKIVFLGPSLRFGEQETESFLHTNLSLSLEQATLKPGSLRKVPTLVFYPSGDELFDAEEAAKNEQLRLVPLPGENHSLEKQGSREVIFRETVRFLVSKRTA